METRELLKTHFVRQRTAAQSDSLRRERAATYTPEQRKRIGTIHKRLSNLIWHSANNLDGKTLPLDWKGAVNRSGANGTRTVDASPWIDIDVLADDRVVQTQLQTWRDQADSYSESGALLTFSSAPTSPMPSIWLRVRSGDGELASEPEELFRFPARDVMFVRGYRVPLEAKHLEQAEGLVADIEAWRAK